MDVFVNILTALGGFAFVIAIIVLIIIFSFKKQLNPFFSNLLKLRYKEFEIERKVDDDATKLDSDMKSAQVDSVESDAEKEISSTLDEKVEDIKADDGNWINKLFVFWQKKDTVGMKQIYEELLYNETDIKEKIRIEIAYYCMLYRLGVDCSQNFQSIEQKCNDMEVYLEAIDMIGDCYKDTLSYEMAEKYYKKGLSKAKELNNSIYTCAFVNKMSYCYFMLDKKNEAYEIIMNELETDKNGDNRFNYYSQLADLYEKDKDLDLYVYMLEKALEIKPNQKTTLFSLAYVYSDKNSHELALLHYKNLLRLDNNHSAALNNIGVSYDRLGMLFKSTERYKQAFDLDNTLAAANLAYKYMQGGLFEEAQDVLKKVRSKEHIHQNVYDASLALENKMASENELEIEKLKEGEKLQRFYKDSIDKKLKSSSPINFILDGKWILNDKDICEIKTVDNTVEITWGKEKFSGKFTNRYFEMTYFKKEYSLILKEYDFENKGKVKGYLSDDDLTISLLKIDKFNDRTFYKLVKQTN